MKNKIVLITGASRGIGSAIMRHFAEAQAKIIATATSEKGIETIQQKTQKEWAVHPVIYQSGTAQNAKDLIAAANAVYDDSIDILINNAGMTRDKLAVRLSEEDWREVLAVNLDGAFYLSSAALRKMIRKSAGRIINISSVVASTGNPGQLNYCASKAGLEGLTRALAREVAARHITVNSIAPGFIHTDMTGQLSAEQQHTLAQQIPMGRIGHPDEIAAVTLFLASDAAAYITGQTIHVNGGLLMGL